MRKQVPKKQKKAPKGKVPVDVRKACRERAEGRCEYCGGKGTQLHHAVFRSQGGQHTPENLILLCNACHKKAHSDDGFRRMLENYTRRREGCGADGAGENWCMEI